MILKELKVAPAISHIKILLLTQVYADESLGKLKFNGKPWRKSALINNIMRTHHLEKVPVFEDPEVVQSQEVDQKHLV